MLEGFVLNPVMDTFDNETIRTSFCVLYDDVWRLNCTMGKHTAQLILTPCTNETLIFIHLIPNSQIRTLPVIFRSNQQSEVFLIVRILVMDVPKHLNHPRHHQGGERRQERDPPCLGRGTFRKTWNMTYEIVTTKRFDKEVRQSVLMNDYSLRNPFFKNSVSGMWIMPSYLLVSMNGVIEITYLG